MSNSRWEQIGAAGGIVFVVLQMAAQALIQAPSPQVCRTSWLSVAYSATTQVLHAVPTAASQPRTR